jgi:hypothetical protein
MARPQPRQNAAPRRITEGRLRPATSRAAAGTTANAAVATITAGTL